MMGKAEPRQGKPAQVQKVRLDIKGRIQREGRAVGSGAGRSGSGSHFALWVQEAEREA